MADVKSPASQQADNALRATFAAMKPAEVAAAMTDAEGWTPDDGSELQGIVLGIKSGTSDYKEKAGRNPHYPIVFVLTDKGAVAVHCFQTVLENEMKSARPLPGEFIYVKRIGNAEKAKPGQSPAIRFAVYVEREGQTSDPWEHMA